MASRKVKVNSTTSPRSLFSAAAAAFAASKSPFDDGNSVRVFAQLSSLLALSLVSLSKLFV
jgi:hypothetical protein